VCTHVPWTSCASWCVVHGVCTLVALGTCEVLSLLFFIGFVFASFSLRTYLFASCRWFGLRVNATCTFSSCFLHVIVLLLNWME
jgi:hypothetical protein